MAAVVEQPEAVLQAPDGLAAADVDVLELRRRDFDRAVAALEQLREADQFVTVFLPDADEVFRHATFAEQLVEGALKVGLLAQGIHARRRDDIVRADRRKVALEPLKNEPVGTIPVLDARLALVQERGARLDAFVADDPGIARDELFDVLRRPVTELAAACRDKEI